MPPSSSYRVAFDFSRWEPTRRELCRAMSCIQEEERRRIRRFRYRADAKASLVGRLLTRRWISDALGMSNETVRLSRTERGRPHLAGSSSDRLQFDFNVAHAGDFTVLAAEASPPTDPPIKVGIDVMPLRDGRNGAEFFRLMRRQLAPSEWDQISKKGRRDQLSAFYRFWCLKESYVKAEGSGLGLDLRTVRFETRSDLEKVGSCVTDTVFCLADRRRDDWRFEEWLLPGGEHCCAVCRGPAEPVAVVERPGGFELPSFAEIVDGLAPVGPAIDEETEWLLYEQKVAVKPHL